MIIKKIAIIGGGNLGTAIARGFVNATNPFEGELIVTRRRLYLIEHLQKEGIQIGSNNLDAVRGADLVILAVKPFQIKDIINEISPVLSDGAILISLAAGVEAQYVSEIAGGKKGIYRVMPNTAISIGESMTCISSFQTSEEQDNLIRDLFERVGKVQFIPEELMAGATVLAACGIAFALRFVRAATQGGIEIGFGSDLALNIASQTVKGAAELLIQGKTHPEAEIDKVTTPRGVTISGLNEMEHQGFSSSLIKGLMTSFSKIDNGSKK